MKKLMIICGLLGCGFAAQGQTCTPDYKLVNDACAPDTTQKPLKMEIVKEKPQVDYQKRGIPNEEIKSKYCLGERLKAQAEKWHVAPENIQINPQNEDSGDRWTEGDFPSITVGTQRRFFCEYVASVPVYPKKADASCPVVGAFDANKCFESGTADEDTVAFCKKLGGQSQPEIVVKGQCYVDALEAAKAGRIGVDIKSLLNYAGTFAVSADNAQVRKSVGDSLGKFYAK